MSGHFLDGFWFRQLLLEIVNDSSQLRTIATIATHFLDGFCFVRFCVFSRFDARYRRSENLHASGRDARSAHAQAILQVSKMHLNARWSQKSRTLIWSFTRQKNRIRKLMRGMGAIGCAAACKRAQPGRALKRICQFWFGSNVKSPGTLPKPDFISLVLHIVQCLFSYTWCDATSHYANKRMKTPLRQICKTYQQNLVGFASSYPARELKLWQNYQRIQLRPVSDVKPSHHTLYSIIEVDTTRFLKMMIA